MPFNFDDEDKFLEETPEESKNSIWSYLLSGLSGLLLIFAFPPFNHSCLAWFALVPLLSAIDKKVGPFHLKSPASLQALQLGYFCGVVFFSGTLYWFIYMKTTAEIPFLLALAAVVAVIAYLSVYFALAAWGSAFFLAGRLPPLTRLLFVPSVWVATEFCRDRFFTGFGWLCLGHSQTPVLPVIQIADITGVFGISFLVVLINICLKEFLREFFGLAKNDYRQTFTWLLIGILVIAGVLGYGFIRLNEFKSSPTGESLRIAVVQGNIAQREKWVPLHWPETLAKYMDLTTQVAAGKPDLIVWPETSFPGFLWQAPERFEGLKQYVNKLGIPLLFGVVTGNEREFFNSAVLLTPGEEQEKKHDKLHLVPFGEYIPLRQQLPFLSAIIPILDFSAGQTPTLFPSYASLPTGLKGEAARFGVLICFEDTVSTVYRRIVAAGADFMVNITNDAWFLDERAAEMHMQAAALNAVAFRRPLVRAANTGVSGLVEANGHVEQFTDSLGRSTFVEGFGVYKLTVKKARSLYGLYGDIFVYCCLFVLVLGLIFVKKRGYHY
jgi:apolipoprotein N-acyltransferase